MESDFEGCVVENAGVVAADLGVFQDGLISNPSRCAGVAGARDLYRACGRAGGN